MTVNDHVIAAGIARDATYAGNVMADISGSPGARTLFAIRMIHGSQHGISTECLTPIS